MSLCIFMGIWPVFTQKGVCLTPKSLRFKTKRPLMITQNPKFGQTDPILHVFWHESLNRHVYFWPMTTAV